jgi:hypothetical protein
VSPPIKFNPLVSTYSLAVASLGLGGGILGGGCLLGSTSLLGGGGGSGGGHLINEVVTKKFIFINLEGKLVL